MPPFMDRLLEKEINTLLSRAEGLLTIANHFEHLHPIIAEARLYLIF